jgi:Spy/CpxP family protein refolding chaperone
MQKGLITLIGLGAAVLLGASGAAAQPFGPGEGGPGSRGFRGPGRILDLTEDQQVAAREIFEQRRPQMEALHEDLRENRRALRDSLESGNPDATLIGELVIEGHALRERGRTLREESKKALEAILNDEQKRKLETLEAARELVGPGGRRGMMGKRGGGWGPRAEGPPGDE